MHHQRYVRRAAPGLLAGLLGGGILATTIQPAWLGFLLAGLAGSTYALAFKPARRAYVDSCMAAAALGVPLWCLVNVVAQPLWLGLTPHWSAAGMRALFPALVGWILTCAAMGLLAQAFNDLALRLLGPEPDPAPDAPLEPTRIVILGGGFAGSTTAAELERVFGADRSVAFTLVSDTNALLFTPMLAEVAASSLEPTHISTPLRSSLRRTTVVRGQVTDIDLQRRRVCVRDSLPAGASRPGQDLLELPFDHLVLALGAVSNYWGLQQVEELAFNFKTLSDAIRIRNHVIDMFERADREPDPQQRRALITFVVAGGGFAGVELAGALNDFVRGMLIYYPHIPPAEVAIICVHARERILPELSESLGLYAQERMTARGVTFKLNTRVADARPGLVILNPHEEIRAETLVWTAGVQPNPLLKTSGLPLDKRGAVQVESTLAVAGLPAVWALGDCAAVVDGKTGKPCPPTAQFALREGRTLARNIRAAIRGERLAPFHFKALGALCVVGHHTACAEIKGWRFSGLLAWLLWRAVYLSKLPGLDRKVRVLSDWVIELFFPRDIVQTLDLGSPAVSKTNQQPAVEQPEYVR